MKDEFWFLRWIQRGEHYRCQPIGMCSYSRGIDTPRTQTFDDVLSQFVVTNFGEQCCVVPKPGCSDGDIRWATPNALAERLFLSKRHTGLSGVEVDTHSTNGDYSALHRSEARGIDRKSTRLNSSH